MVIYSSPRCVKLDVHSVRCAFPLLCEASLMVTACGCDYNVRAFSNSCFRFSQFPQSVAYAENFHGGLGSFSGIWWSFSFGVRSL